MLKDFAQNYFAWKTPTIAGNSLYVSRNYRSEIELTVMNIVFPMTKIDFLLTNADFISKNIVFAPTNADFVNTNIEFPTTYPESAARESVSVGSKQ